MVKRGAAFVFILIANSILLAHAVLPHHHHDNQVCFSVTPGNHDDTRHQHPRGTGAGHENNGDKDAGECVLFQVIVLPVNRHQCIYYCCNDVNPHFDQLHYAPLYNGLGAFGCFSSPRVNTPATKNSISRVLAASIGLRAPPIV